MNNVDLHGRRARIVSLLSSCGTLSATSLAQMLEVTVQTVRSDLRALDDDGRVRRRHGAAYLVSPTENIGYQPRSSVARLEKMRIASAVAELIPDGASVALGTGTTVEACARALSKHRGLRIFTNNIHVVMAMGQAPEVSVAMAGGAVRLRDMDVIGTDSADFFAAIRPDYAVFSIGGMSEKGELLDFTMDEIRARRAIHDCAQHKILVLHQAKANQCPHHAMGRIWEVDTVVVAGTLPVLVKQELSLSHRRVIYC